MGEDGGKVGTLGSMSHERALLERPFASGGRLLVFDTDNLVSRNLNPCCLLVFSRGEDSSFLLLYKG